MQTKNKQNKRQAMFFISSIIVSPIDSLKSVFGTADGRWRLLRILVCIGSFIGFMFWAGSQRPHTEETSESAVERDKVIQLLQPLNQLLLDNYAAVPYISTFFLCIIYMLLITLLARYISEGDHIFPEIVTDWGIALSLTLVTSEPLSRTAIRYYEDLYYPLEFFASDTVVSWHMLVLIVSSRHLLLRYKSVLMSISFAILYCAQALFLLSARVTYSPAVVFAILIALFGARVRDFFIERATRFKTQLQLKNANGGNVRTSEETATFLRTGSKKFTVDEVNYDDERKGSESDIDIKEETELQDM